MEYGETFSLVAKLSTVRFLIDVAVKKNWSLSQLNISNAFLNGDMDEKIFMKLPHGYSDIRGESYPPYSICRLHKYIYDLKQASRQWYLKLSSTLKGMRFQKCHSDLTLFIKHLNGRYLAVMVYVDDILIPSNNDEAVQEFEDALQSYFKVRNIGTLKYFLGFEVATLLFKDVGTLLENPKLYRKLVVTSNIWLLQGMILLMLLLLLGNSLLLQEILIYKLFIKYLDISKERLAKRFSIQLQGAVI